MNDSLLSRVFILKQLRFEHEVSVSGLSQTHVLLIKFSSNYSALEIYFFCRYIGLLLVNRSCWQNEPNTSLMLITQDYLGAISSNFSKKLKIIAISQKSSIKLLSYPAFRQNYFFPKNLYGDKSTSLKVGFIQCSGSKS